MNIFFYIYSVEVNNETKRQLVWKTKDLIKDSGGKMQSEGDVKNHNSSYQLYTTLKLPIETLSSLSKALSDAVRSVPQLEKIVDELKELRAMTEVPESNKTDKAGKALLTLFTSWDENNKARSLVYNNTIRNWASFKPVINPVLFTNNESLKARIAKQGWQTLPLLRTSAHGIPILKYLYLSAMSNFESDFYAFANSDILFNGNLLKTLVTAKYSLDISKPMLITGSRYNVLNVTDDEAKERSNLIKIAKERGELFLPWAADYFITTKAFPWMDIPEIIIASLGFDNWIILYSREKRFLVIDGTKTIPTIHQTIETGNFESHGKVHAGYNLELLKNVLKKDIDFQKGQVVCTEMVSSFEKDSIIFEKRAESQSYCPI